MSRASITIRNSQDRSRVALWVAKAPFGTRIDFKAGRRSLPQNDRMWSRLTEIATKVIWHGEKLTAADWKDIFTASLRKARVVPGIDPGTTVLLGLRTSDMSKDEMGNLLDLIDAFAAQQGVTFNEGERAA